MKLPPPQSRLAARRESGSLLIIVMWIAFGLVALTLYFANAMNQELRASENRAAGMAANQAVDSAARYLSNFLANSASPGYMPQGIDISCEEVPVGESKYWLIGRNTNDWEVNQSTPSFGLIDEASKINLNAPWLTADAIQYLPGMTPQIAAAIMDWRDTNSDVTANGAEDETYGRLPTPYRTKNGPFESVEELHLVAGVTRDILYGEDANLNGVLDANENDADDSAPTDNRDSRLDPGLMEYFTIYSREPNVGTNIHDATSLQTLLQTTLGQQRATDIMNNFQTRTAGGGGRPPTVTSTLSAVGSLLEFYLRSGMTEDEFAQVYDSLNGSTNEVYTEGFVNVNTASQAVLECVPGIGVDYGAQLVTYREANPTKLNTIAWVADAMGNDTNAVQAGPYITTRSYQYTADVAAVGPHNRGYRRVRFVFDTSEGAPAIIYRRDLTHLGWALGKETRTQLLARKEENQATTHDRPQTTR